MKSRSLELYTGRREGLHPWGPTKPVLALNRVLGALPSSHSRQPPGILAELGKAPSSSVALPGPPGTLAIFLRQGKPPWPILALLRSRRKSLGVTD